MLQGNGDFVNDLLILATFMLAVNLLYLFFFGGGFLGGIPDPSGSGFTLLPLDIFL